ncbi:Sensor histidine kinase RcsC [Paraburkholderia aspalathi]|uniref:histidine kinase n=1 Tax=Paraburkholderia aspalathi TaxID=1324617 RepID=A0ABM8RLI4_9BURK|nr:MULTISPECIES: hybrid sensor histidine kinase/response regulator [Paraburkholderia]MBK3743815.1 hybrid sensor histidine kinase/response regulator [Paraburkholderia aspalathi]MBK3819679.1 hybrid sensor histidine kinase/response regulator [Paraburkholderia aspalathi]MBK3831571.1 hybrid sensor histidine kinase/response regulator [Paraburkholderia aspalathi]MBK3861351.1 hybrid sensor histidine kinase/response regulator [Paraburkholderia aspalathi]CAE6759582.1 Sensor histidine kinase RcsC [Parabu
MTDDPRRPSLIDLFREEARTQARVLNDGLLTLDRAPSDAAALEACMRAAHSLKGAARIVGVQVGVELAHAMEDCFVAAQEGRALLDAAWIDELLRGVDIVARIGNDEDESARDAVSACVASLQARMVGVVPHGAAMRRDVLPPAAPARVDSSASATSVATKPQNASADADAAFNLLASALRAEATPAPTAPASATANASTPPSGTAFAPVSASASASATPLASSNASASADATSAAPASASGSPSATASTSHESNAPTTDPGRMLRVRADNLDRLLSLSGESLVESRWLKPFAQSMLRVKRVQRDGTRALDQLHETLADLKLDPRAHAALEELRRLTAESQHLLAERLADLESFDRRSTHLSQQLYDAALQCRMRPFGDGTSGLARMVRDVARSLGKKVRWQLVGESTQVDRDILDLLEAPLGHMLRNAIDHGIEAPAVRLARGKPEEGTLTLDARHTAGALLISVSDDGAGIDLDALRTSIVRRKLASAETAARLSETELLEFLLLPGFSLRDQVTEVSGRGVGLDAVHDVVKRVRGTVRITHEPGVGTRVQLQLPLTLSVIRSLLVEVAGEPYAVPLAHVNRTLHVSRADIELLEGHQHIAFDGRRIGVVTAHQILDTAPPANEGDTVSLIVIGDGEETYGVVVDRFLGERMLVVQPLDPRLGKIRNITAGALMENGDPVLIADVDDWLRSVERLVAGGDLKHTQHGAALTARRVTRRVLVVDDSLTVRELERKLLATRGYDVTIAVDGMDGWNAVRGEHFDLVITDIDMPRMDGIELVTLIKRDPQLQSLPVMIVSYKDREEDRRAGLNAGADYYLAKGSFHDEALLDAVRDLIGEAYG